LRRALNPAGAEEKTPYFRTGKGNKALEDAFEDGLSAWMVESRNSEKGEEHHLPKEKVH
jgi:hypothetical protein